jgi:hypothetical protein
MPDPTPEQVEAAIAKADLTAALQEQSLRKSLSNHKNIQVWADEDIVGQIDITSSGQKRIDLFLVDFFDPTQSVMVHLGPKQALAVITELQHALIELLPPEEN